MAEIETDKATMEFESYQEGVLLYRGDEDKSAPVDGILAILGKSGEDFKSLLEAEQSKPVVSAPAPAPAAEQNLLYQPSRSSGCT